MPQLADALAQALPLLDGAKPVSPDPLAGLRARAAAHALAGAGAHAIGPGPRPMRYLIRLALCLIAAEAVAMAASPPRSYWVPLIVVVIFKPNFGSVFARAAKLRRRRGGRGHQRDRAGRGPERCGQPADGGGAGRVAALVHSPQLRFVLGHSGAHPDAVDWRPATRHLDHRMARLVDVGVAAGIVLVVGYLPWIRIERSNLDHAVVRVDGHARRPI